MRLTERSNQVLAYLGMALALGGWGAAVWAFYGHPLVYGGVASILAMLLSPSAGTRHYGRLCFWLGFSGLLAFLGALCFPMF